MKWTREVYRDEQFVPQERSSHSVTHLNNKLYVFGGENDPRSPISSDVHIYDLGSKSWSVVRPSEGAPKSRLAHTTTDLNEKLFVYGGRDANGVNLNELHVFDTENNTWQSVAVNQDEGIAGRSYHTATRFNHDQSKFFVFGGCSDKGRLNELLEFDAQSQKFTIIEPRSGQAPSARGGPGFTAVGDSLLYVFGGFNGNELGDLHVFDYRCHAWNDLTSQMKGSVPGARSVHVVKTLGESDIFVFGGEREASSVGHLGAGKFRNDTYLLDTNTLEWKCMDDVSSHNVDQRPSERGWLDATCINDRQIALFGGYCEEGRLNDLFIFEK